MGVARDRDNHTPEDHRDDRKRLDGKDLDRPLGRAGIRPNERKMLLNDRHRERDSIEPHGEN